MLHECNRDLYQLYEAPHAYPVLHYFHFRDRFYALSQMVIIMADLIAVARSTLHSGAS